MKRKVIAVMCLGAVLGGGLVLALVGQDRSQKTSSPRALDARAPESIQSIFTRRHVVESGASEVLREMAERSTPVEPARLVARSTVPSGKDVFLWAAPTKRGWCYFLQVETPRRPGATYGGGSCPGRFFREERVFSGYLLFERVRPTVRTIEFQLTDGRSLRKPVTSGFYMLAIPSAVGIVGEPVARDADGRVVPLGRLVRKPRTGQIVRVEPSG